MSSFIAPLKHGNTNFIQSTVEDLEDKGQEEFSPAKDEANRPSSFPGLVLALNRIRRGQILVPMSNFLDVAAPQIINPTKNHAARIDAASVQALLRAFSRTALTFNQRPSQVVQKTNRARLWKPAQLPAGADTSRMPVNHLCVYALATVYDIACQLNISPSQESLAMTIRALASSDLDLQTFGQCVTLLFLQLSGVTFHEAQVLAADSPMQFRLFDAHRMDAVIVAAAIDGFGTHAKPELGETLLRWWSAARRGGIEKDSVTAYMPPNTPIEATCWHDNELVWNALFRARSLKDDVRGARHWLEEYRRLFPPENRSAWMYREYARLCTVSSNVEALNIEEDSITGGESFKLGALREALTMISKDGVGYDEMILSVFLNTLIGFGKLDEAASKLHRAFASGHLPRYSIGLCKAVFRLHKLHLIRNPGDQGAFSKAIEAGPEISADNYRYFGPYDEPRRYTVRFAQHIQRIESLKQKIECPALEEALLCAIVHGDLPLALFVLDRLQRGSFLLGQKTSDTVQRWLARCHDGGSAARRGGELDSALQRSSRLALHAARMRLLEPTSPVAQSSRKNDSGYRLVRQAIRSTLLRAARSALSYDERKRLETCSGWLCALSEQLIDRSHDTITDKEIIKAAIRQVTSTRPV